MNQDIKKTVSNVYFKRLGLLLKSKLNARNLINVINTWAVVVVRYSSGLAYSTNKELGEIDRKTRYLLVEKKFSPFKSQYYQIVYITKG